MKYLVIGLGNVGREYSNTRHNVGFMVLDGLAAQSNTIFRTDRLADVATIKHKGRTLVLVKPSTYMNLSGRAVAYWMEKEGVSIDNVIVVVDDIAIPFGSLRLRKGGSAGGHNGLLNIAEVLKSEQYTRLRVGIGGEFSKGQQVDYVLGEWTDEQSKDLPDVIKRVGEGLLSIAFVGVDLAMNNINKR